MENPAYQNIFAPEGGQLQIMGLMDKIGAKTAQNTGTHTTRT
jgi:hypothetical protein